MEQLTLWSSFSWAERNIYIENCTFEELKSLKELLYGANQAIGGWNTYLNKIDEEILKRLQDIRDNKINEILK